MTNKLCDDWVLYDCSICGECHEEENKDRDRENEQLQDLRTEMNQMKIKLEEMMKINDNYQREERKKVTDDDINKDSGTESKSKMSTSKTSSAKSKKTVIDATTATGTERPLCTTDTDVVLTRQMDEILTLREANISLNNKLKDKDRQLTKFADLVGVYKEQANAYKEDFKKERQDRERLMDELLWYKEKFTEASNPRKTHTAGSTYDEPWNYTLCKQDRQYYPHSGPRKFSQQQQKLPQQQLQFQHKGHHYGRQQLQQQQRNGRVVTYYYSNEDDLTVLPRDVEID